MEIIVAVDENYGIGKDGDLLAHLSPAGVNSGASTSIKHLNGSAFLAISSSSAKLYCLPSLIH